MIRRSSLAENERRDPYPRPSPLRRAAYWAIAACLSFQAVAGALELSAVLSRSLREGYAERLFATTGQRLAREAGIDFEIARLLRESARDGEIVLVSLSGDADARGIPSERRFFRVRRLLDMLFPRPLIVPIPKDPASFGEQSLRPGQTVLLLVLDGDESPKGRAGWTIVHESEEYEVWRLQKV
ncbi:MAG: hypothetical protein Fur0037_17720 [Planctomycetota bacterium]